MRGGDIHQEGMFSYVSAESRIPKSHPRRRVRVLVDEALKEFSGQFELAYTSVGGPSIPPEKLIRALLLQMFCSIRSERLLCDQRDYNLLFRWFVGLSVDDPVWNHSTFSKARDRMTQADMAQAMLERVVEQARRRHLTSDEHSSVDGTLIEAWASVKGVRPRDGSDEPPEGGGRNPRRDFRGEQRRNDTHVSTTEPEAKLFRDGSGRAAKLCHMGHLTGENRNGLIITAALSQVVGRAEREQVIEMVRHIPGAHRITLGADKSNDTREFIEQLRSYRITPARGAERHQPTLGYRPRLRAQPTGPQDDRGAVRLDERHRPDAKDQIQRRRPSWLSVVAQLRRVQPGAHAQPAGPLTPA